ncbi:F-box/LRR-repeat protein 12-like [Amphiura filiformis]|uniref:F-box/LRR-repeat protein 12-like n=1 Tax=Amphiura filiformis TaxID=82378 RepID=UPI003B22870B
MAEFKIYLSGMSLIRAYDNSTYQIFATSSSHSHEQRVLKKVSQHNYDCSAFELEVLHLNQNQDAPAHHQEPHLIASTSQNETTPASSHQTIAAISPQWKFDNLPSVVVNHIFSYLEHKDLCRMSQVCKQWHDAARNPRLWKIVQQTPSDSDHLMVFLKSYIGKPLVFLRPFSMSTSGLQHINQNCCNIQALWLVDIELKSLDLTYLPSSLVSLALVPSSEMHHPDGEWWKILNISKFPNLDFLFLSRTVSSDDLLQQVTQLTTLTGFRFEECKKSISEATISELTNRLTNLQFLSFTGCNGVKIQYLEYIGRHLKCLHQLRLNRMWTLNPEQDLACLTALPELKILHIQNGTDADTVQVQEFCDSFACTLDMFSKMGMLVVTDLKKHEAVLTFRTASCLQMQRNMQVMFEKVKGQESYWVRAIFSDIVPLQNTPVQN